VATKTWMTKVVAAVVAFVSLLGLILAASAGYIG
jgi:hypothetical protein